MFCTNISAGGAKCHFRERVSFEGPFSKSLDDLKELASARNPLRCAPNWQQNTGSDAGVGRTPCLSVGALQKVALTPKNTMRMTRDAWRLSLSSGGREWAAVLVRCNRHRTSTAAHSRPRSATVFAATHPRLTSLFLTLSPMVCCIRQRRLLQCLKKVAPLGNIL